MSSQRIAALAAGRGGASSGCPQLPAARRRRGLPTPQRDSAQAPAQAVTAPFPAPSAHSDLSLSRRRVTTDARLCGACRRRFHATTVETSLGQPRKQGNRAPGHCCFVPGVLTPWTCRGPDPSKTAGRAVDPLSLATTEACLGGAMTDRRREPSPSASVPPGGVRRTPPGGTGTGSARASCCQSRLHRHVPGGGLASRFSASEGPERNTPSPGTPA